MKNYYISVLASRT